MIADLINWHNAAVDGIPNWWWPVWIVCVIILIYKKVKGDW